MGGNVSVDLGNTLSIAKTQEQPRVQFEESIDIFSALNGTDVKSLGKVSGKVVTSYNPPSPPKGSGPHRYIILLYKQHGGVDGKVSHNRANFNVTRFAEENKLEGPIAGNFFSAENK